MTDLFHVDIPGRTIRHRNIECEELVERVGEREAMRINFIPNVFYALACDEGLELCDRAAALRLKELRTFTRAMRQSIREYSNLIAGRVSDARAYQQMLERYNDVVTTDRWLAVLKLQEDARNQLPGRDELICAHLCLMVLLVRFATEFERNTAKQLAEVFADEVQNVNVKYDRPILEAANAAVDIGAAGYAFKPSKQAILSVRVLANRAYALADKIIDEELNN